MALRRSAARAACSSSEEASEPVSFGMVTEGGGGAWACDAPREVRRRVVMHHAAVEFLVARIRVGVRTQ